MMERLLWYWGSRDIHQHRSVIVAYRATHRKGKEWHWRCHSLCTAWCTCISVCCMYTHTSTLCPTPYCDVSDQASTLYIFCMCVERQQGYHWCTVYADLLMKHKLQYINIYGVDTYFGIYWQCICTLNLKTANSTKLITMRWLNPVAAILSSSSTVHFVLNSCS